MTTASVTDGRAARSQRTRTAVVDALLALLQDGNPRPTAREIAARAQVSLRSVYVHFDDLDDLFVAAAQRQVELVADLLVRIEATGPLAERADAVMRTRARIYTEIGAVLRAAELHAPFSAALTRRRDAGRRAARDELARVFATELDVHQPRARAQRLALLEVLTDHKAWDDLRESGLDADAARDAATGAIVALLECP
jgi:AcrR family transcriptional regulator